MLDPRAVRILSNAFWSPRGWHRAPPSDEDFAYAKAQGVMFDPVVFGHDAAVSWAISARNAIAQDGVVDAFLVSLRSRRLDLRSGLGSYAAVRHLVAHRHEGRSGCAVCGEYDLREPEDLNVLNFERIKWGGVRHSQPLYAGFDLTQLAVASFDAPTREDWAKLAEILDVAQSLPSKARLKDLDSALKTVIPSNSAERRTLIEILGYCGILVDPSHPDFRRSYVRSDRRERTHWHTDDWHYPVQWWTAVCGISKDAVADWFGRLP